MKRTGQSIPVSYHEVHTAPSFKHVCGERVGALRVDRQLRVSPSLLRSETNLADCSRYTFLDGTVQAWVGNDLFSIHEDSRAAERAWG